MHGALHKLRGWGRLGFGTASTDRGWLLGSLLQDSRASLLLGYRSNLVREVDLKSATVGSLLNYRSFVRFDLRDPAQCFQVSGLQVCNGDSDTQDRVKRYLISNPACVVRVTTSSFFAILRVSGSL